MTSTTAAIDIDGLPDLERLTREVQENGTIYVLRQDGREVAILVPVAPPPRSRAERTSEADRADFLSIAGGWAGLVDGDELIKQIYADRDITERSLPEM